MGNRISKVYTKVGDGGSTDIGNGSKILKNDIRIQLYGDIDELSSNIGFLIALTQNKFPIGVDYDLNLVDIISLLSDIQNLLFDFSGDIIIEHRQSITENHVTWLENWIDHFNQDLPSLKDFILPGGNLSSSYCHVVRTVCRRTERSLVEFNNVRETYSQISELRELYSPCSIKMSKYHLMFLNRLSDFLFVVARVLNKHCAEPIWSHETTLRFPKENDHGNI